MAALDALLTRCDENPRAGHLRPELPPDRAASSLEDSDENSDESLVERLRSGDRSAFSVLYDRYFRRVYSFLDRRLPTRADTEETTQEVFVALFSSIESFRGEAPFAAWVFGITRRTLAARFKRKQHPTVSLPETETDGNGEWTSYDLGGDPLAAYECQERLHRLGRAMERELSPEQRELVWMHHLQSRSIQDIATHLGKSEDAVKSNLYRARKLLLAR